ncbi:MAG TPA: LytR C-terminal domain-containing protein [Bacteroidota bacterium]|nr:LytR C-terminal domain-containing protein [Bacteroidota bacterium]
MRTLFTGIILLLVLLVGYLGYSFISRSSDTGGNPIPKKPIQLDLLNGCGAKGVGSKFMSYLRANGFDVVEMKNYKTFNVPQTLVIDRTGNLTAAKRVASALGVPDKNVIQQLNADYFVDVSVVIGKDFESLHPNH